MYYICIAWKHKYIYEISLEYKSKLSLIPRLSPSKKAAIGKSESFSLTFLTSTSCLWAGLREPGNEAKGSHDVDVPDSLNNKDIQRTPLLCAPFSQSRGATLYETIYLASLFLTHP